MNASYCWGSHRKVVYYGMASWPSYSFWLVPGTVTDEDSCGT